MSLPNLKGKMSAEDFRAARRKMGLSQQALAELLDVDVMTVSRWERGLVPVSRVCALAMRHLLANHPERR